MPWGELARSKFGGLMSTVSNRKSSLHLELIFEIYSIIPTSRKVTAREIQQLLTDKHIERSKRTIQRCLDIIVRYFEVEKDDRSIPYGYCRKVKATLIFGPREYLLLGFAQSALKALLPDSYHAVIDNALTPLTATSVPQKRVDIRWPPFDNIKTYDATVFETLCVAIYYQREVRLTWVTNDSLQYVKPLGLILEHHQLYLTYLHHACIHSVAITSVKSVYLTTYEFAYPANFQLTQIKTAYQAMPLLKNKSDVSSNEPSPSYQYNIKEIE
ncbi:hypothetical protein VSVS05_03118 [Vibrio scophthalmi]|uniref:WYL domain-containing protein n=2 Tax=Vibrio scophthalmi TaxID=45658 RepID=A0A1C7FE24_9VIBR|nr:hypothetical protein VSVS05_03118 [Vibrio scophthalmi]